MTSTKILPGDDVGSDHAPESRQKGVLFCPTCGYESVVGGDWLVDSDGETATSRCPDCRTVVADR
jgi:endogenous inhibitor of DNA gyrase (YacG/DUF329 family)